VLQYLMREVPLITGRVGLMLPGAKIIHCMRDPRDIGLSIWSINARSRPMASLRRAAARDANQATTNIVWMHSSIRSVDRHADTATPTASQWRVTPYSPRQSHS
jgi:hypothetical protein